MQTRHKAQSPDNASSHKDIYRKQSKQPQYKNRNTQNRMNEYRHTISPQIIPRHTADLRPKQQHTAQIHNLQTLFPYTTAQINIISDNIITKPDTLSSEQRRLQSVQTHCTQNSTDKYTKYTLLHKYTMDTLRHNSNKITINKRYNNTHLNIHFNTHPINLY